MNKKFVYKVGNNKKKSYTMMHGQPNIKICIAKQAKQIFQYKKIKIKLYKKQCGHLVQQNLQD